MASRRQILLMIAALGGCRPAVRTAMPSPQRSVEAARCTIGRIVATASGQLDVELRGMEFPVQNELPSLRIGPVTSHKSRHPEDGDTQHLLFTFESAELATVPDGAEVQLRYGDADDAPRLPCGRFDRRLLDPGALRADPRPLHRNGGGT